MGYYEESGSSLGRVYLSEYAIAVKHGFEGSEEEWIRQRSEAAVRAVEAAEQAVAAREEADQSAVTADEAHTRASTAAENAEAAAERAENAVEDIDQSIGRGEQILAEIESEKTAIEAIAVRTPYIGPNGNWYVWDNTTSEYVDSEVRATGPQGDPGDPGAGLPEAAPADNGKILMVDNGAWAKAVPGYLEKSGGIMTGALTAQGNSNYAVAQVRNIILVTALPNPADVPDGALVGVYLP